MKNENTNIIKTLIFNKMQKFFTSLVIGLGLYILLSTPLLIFYSAVVDPLLFIIFAIFSNIIAILITKRIYKR